MHYHNEFWVALGGRSSMGGRCPGKMVGVTTTVRCSWWCFCSANFECVEVLGKVTGKWQQKAAKAAEVLNLYHYFNSCEEEPCRSHADPGLVTVLGRSTLPGLQAVLPVKPGGAPGRPAVYEDHWCDLEPLMDELGQGQPNWRENILVPGGNLWGSWPRSSEISRYPSLSQVPEVMKSC